MNLAVAAAAHDIERQDEGEDHWDHASAQFLQSYLVSRNLSFKGFKKLVSALSEKDPPGRKFKTNIQRIIHDADCLEIMRVLKDANSFRPQELAIFDMPEIDAALRDKMIEEVGRFIKKTESFELKLDLEQHSANYYTDVLKMITQDEFPTLYKLLQKEIESLKSEK